jgi:2-hydroxychromene-2-carboxylate isomerase
MKHLIFYLDFISPYAYLAFEKLPQALQGLSYSVTYKPILFASLLKAQLKPADDAAGEAVKARLKANSDEALARGAFGVPTIEVDGKLFWGLDALPMLRDCLDGGAWFQSPDWEAAPQVPVGIRRKA